MNFALDPGLEADTFTLGDFALRRVLLINNAFYEWLIVVPRRPQLVEIVDLASSQQAALNGSLLVLFVSDRLVDVVTRALFFTNRI